MARYGVRRQSVAATALWLRCAGTQGWSGGVGKRSRAWLASALQRILYFGHAPRAFCPLASCAVASAGHEWHVLCHYRNLPETTPLWPCRAAACVATGFADGVP